MSLGKAFSHPQNWPDWAYRLPQWGMALYLAVRHRSLTAISAANPYFEGGGLVGASKSQILSLLPKDAPVKALAWVVVRRHADVARTLSEAASCVAQSRLSYPLVAKPDIGTHGKGVVLIEDEQGLRDYAQAYPLGERFMLQSRCDWPVQATIVYARQPDEAKGRVLSLVLREIPSLTGDGVRTIRELVLNDAYAAERAHLYLPQLAARWNDVVGAGEPVPMAFAASRHTGARLIDRSDLIDDALHDAWEAVALSLPEFYYGAFDVCAQSMDDLLAARDVRLIEIDGAGAEELSVYDGRRDVYNVYKTLWSRQALAYDIGADNRRRGHKADSALYLLSLWVREKALMRLYRP